MTERRRFPVGLTITTAIAFAILIGLGTWQVRRLAWKEDLLAQIAALQAAPARSLAVVLDTGGDLDFVRVTAICPGIAQAPFLELYSLRDGQAGARIISACRGLWAQYRTILVDRGFVGDTISARPTIDPADEMPVVVTGVLRRPERGNRFTPPNRPDRWFSRDIVGMSAVLKAPVPAPVFLMAETRTNPEWPALTPAPVPVDIPNRHLEYALTWYGLAAALLGVYAAMLFQRWKS